MISPRPKPTDKHLRVLLCGLHDESFAQLLANEGISSLPLQPSELPQALQQQEVAAVVLGTEALAHLPFASQREAAGDQGLGRDRPFILLLGAEWEGDLGDVQSKLPNLTLLERTAPPALVLASVRTALHQRSRQMEAEERIKLGEYASERLQEVMETLEQRVRQRMRELASANERLRRDAEEREATQELLRESEELYRYTVELSQQLAWTASVDGTIVQISPRFYEITGAESGLSAHEAWLSVIHPDDLDWIVSQWAQALQSETPHQAQFRMQVKDGSYRLFQARAAPRRDRDGQVLRWYGFTEDIEDRMRAEERLRESEELYRYTLELGRHIVWTAGPDGAFLTMSARFTEMTGGTAATPPQELIHPDDIGKVMNAWGKAVSSGRLHHVEFRMRVLDGSYRMFRSRAAPRLDEGGKVIRWYGFTEDIDDQIQEQAARLQAEERYRLAVRATNDAVWDADLQAEEIHWSKSEDGVFGHSGAATTSLLWWESKVHPEDSEHVVRGFHAALSSNQDRWSAEYRFLSGDGRYLRIFDRCFIIRDAQGRAIRAVGAMADVTERRHAEAEMRRLQAELIHISRVSAMGTMASTLAHELNQPLTAVSSYISGSLRLLDREQSLDQAKGALRAAESAALKGGQILRRLREFVSRGNVTVKPEDLRSLVDEACALGLVDQQRLGVKRKVKIDAGCGSVLADKVQIQQVLINLVRNSVQAMHESKRKEVLISSRSAPGNMVELSVADTGPGIAPAAQAELFSPFHSTKSDGMGIGLSISRTIVEAHGGNIWAEDRPGGGAIFRFTLPMAEGAEGS